MFLCASDTLTVTSLFFLVVALVGYFFLVSTHFHYSVDVFIGVIISSTIFSGYHALLKTLHERRSGPFKSLLMWIEQMPEVGEFIQKEEEEVRILTMQRRALHAHQAEASQTVPRAQFEPPPAWMTALSARDEEAQVDLHTYVFYSVTRNRYVLKRVAEVIRAIGSDDNTRTHDMNTEEKKATQYGTSIDYTRHQHEHHHPYRSYHHHSGLVNPNPHAAIASPAYDDSAYLEEEADRQYAEYGLTPAGEPFTPEPPTSATATHTDTNNKRANQTGVEDATAIEGAEHERKTAQRDEGTTHATHNDEAERKSATRR